MQTYFDAPTFFTLKQKSTLISPQEALYIEGTTPVLITCLNGHEYHQNGRKFPKKEGTFAFAYTLSRILDAHFFATHKPDLPDANFDLHSPLKMQILATFATAPPHILIDIHDTPAIHFADIIIDSHKGQSCKNVPKFPSVLLQTLRAFQMVVDVDTSHLYESATLGGQSMVHFSSEQMRIDALGVHINSAFLTDDKTPATLHRQCQILHALCHFVHQNVLTIPKSNA